MRKQLALATVFCFAVTATAAKADLFTVDIDHSSGSPVYLGQSLGTIDLEQISPTEVTIEFKANTALVDGFHEIGFNYSGGPTAFSALTINETVQTGGVAGEFSLNPANSSMDGFGQFLQSFGPNAAGPVPQMEASDIKFDFQGPGLNLAEFEHLSQIPPGDTPVDFAVGFAYQPTVQGGRTGFAGAEPSSVPEPMEFMALGGLSAMGLIGAGWNWRKARPTTG